VAQHDPARGCGWLGRHYYHAPANLEGFRPCRHLQRSHVRLLVTKKRFRAIKSSRRTHGLSLPRSIQWSALSLRSKSRLDEWPRAREWFKDKDSRRQRFARWRHMKTGDPGSGQKVPGSAPGEFRSDATFAAIIPDGNTGPMRQGREPVLQAAGIPEPILIEGRSRKGQRHTRFNRRTGASDRGTGVQPDVQDVRRPSGER